MLVVADVEQEDLLESFEAPQVAANDEVKVIEVFVQMRIDNLVRACVLGFDIARG